MQAGALEMLKALLVTHNRPMDAFEIRLALGTPRHSPYAFHHAEIFLNLMFMRFHKLCFALYTDMICCGLFVGSVANMVIGLCADGPVRLKSKAEDCCLFLCQQPKVGVGLMSRYLLEAANSAGMKARKDKGRAVVLARLKLLDTLLDGVVQEQRERAQGGSGGSGGDRCGPAVACDACTPVCLVLFFVVVVVVVVVVIV
eukprot:COSAG05_NODE_2830_length_2592_cov_47.594063_1_plen_199_part_10